MSNGVPPFPDLASYDRIEPSNFSCEQDSNLMGSDFDNEESGVSGIKRYWAVLYVFKFYNSNDIFFSCTVTVCPSGSSSCDIVSIQFWQHLLNITLELVWFH